MGLNDKVSAERAHIGFFGLRNAGKSSVVNAVTGQKLSLVSDRVGGVSNYFDTIEDVGQFTIVDDPQVNDGYLWAERLWGNMRFPPLEMQRVETEEV